MIFKPTLKPKMYLQRTQRQKLNMRDKGVWWRCEGDSVTLSVMVPSNSSTLGAVNVFFFLSPLKGFLLELDAAPSALAPHGSLVWFGSLVLSLFFPSLFSERSFYSVALSAQWSLLFWSESFTLILYLCHLTWFHVEFTFIYKKRTKAKVL